MTITTEQAIALAREVGATWQSVETPVASYEYSVISSETLTALCNAVRNKTLLEAAEYGEQWTVPMVTVNELRQMADEC